MTFEVSPQLENRLRDIAGRQGRDLDAVVDEALRRYIIEASIGDLSPAEVAATQEKLARELNVEPWSS